MKFTVIGCSGTYPTHESPCSAYLFSAEGYNLLVDLGPGTFVALQRYIDLGDLDALLLTHFHPDHCIDIYPLYYALRFSDSFERKISVYAPGGAESSLFGFLSGDSKEEFARIFAMERVSGGNKLQLGPFDVELSATNHPIETLAVAVSNGRATVTYSADTGPGGGFPELAAKADVVVCEATYEREGQGPPIHLASRQAAQIVKESGAARLVLTHRFPTCDRDRWFEEAASTYGGVIDAAFPGLELDL
ncbi:MAG: MBL fold metallo-hydrolase [Acidimicrobiia bacterium]